MVAEAIGPLLIPALIFFFVVVCIAAVIFSLGFAVFVMLGAVGVMAIRDRIGRAKRLAGEVGSEDDAW